MKKWERGRQKYPHWLTGNVSAQITTRTSVGRFSKVSATLHEKGVLAGGGTKMKGQNRKKLCLYNTKQRPAAVLKKLENVLSVAPQGFTQCSRDARRARL